MYFLLKINGDFPKINKIYIAKNTMDSSKQMHFHYTGIT